MKFVTSFPLSGNGTDFREFGYTGSSDDISGCWIAVTICLSGARHNILSLGLIYLSTYRGCETRSISSATRKSLSSSYSKQARFIFGTTVVRCRPGCRISSLRFLVMFFRLPRQILEQYLKCATSLPSCPFHFSLNYHLSI
jgi:hypothetical protein